MRRFLAIPLLLLTWSPLRSLNAEDAAADDARQNFVRVVRPFLDAHCITCHAEDGAEGGLSFERYQQSAHIQTDIDVWEKVLRMLTERAMPPADNPQPPEAELQAVIQEIQAQLQTYDCQSAAHPGRVTLRRLNRAEYNNTIRDLLGLEFRPADDFPSDDVGEGFDNIGDVLSMPPLLMEKYLDAAETIVDRALAEESSRNRILVHSAATDEADAKIAAFVENVKAFATRAFRRPVTDEDLQPLLDIAKAVHEQGFSDQDVLRTVLQAVLVSPQFLFRIEQDPGPDDEDGVRALDDYEVATRLSYFLWSSMPDAELFDLAAQGRLRDPSVLRAQVTRMLLDEKSQALVDNFAGQWLQLRDLAHLNPDPDLFPAFDSELRQAMRRETELLFTSIMRENLSILELLTSDYSFVNARLAEHYGLPGIDGEDFRRVKLPEQRRGVLTHGSILLLTSNPTRTSPVKRGKWILDNILGEPPPPPPAGVEELEETGVALGTLRERMDQHRSNESCAVCHRRMDPLGFGLENFDAVGAWRDYDGRAAIDSSGVLPGDVRFSGAAELVGILAEQKSNEYVRCLSKKLLTYALGRGVSSSDRCAIDRIVREAQNDDFRFHTLIGAIVTSEPFLLREAQKGP